MIEREPDPDWHVAVVVPARDEAATIERCLRSVHRAAAALTRPTGTAPVTTDVIVVADSCADDTAARARRSLGGRGLVAEVRSGSVGAARRAGTGLAIRRSRTPPERTWIASTDGDSTVPRTWLLTQLAIAVDGAHAVAGVVRLERGAERTRRLRRSFAAAYELDTDGSHRHVHGANLGVRADTYLAVGGWAELASGEDHDLWRRLRERAPTVSTTASYVRTSARRTGRAPDGFAADLTALDGSTAEPA